MSAAAEHFRAADVQIVRGYFVTCNVCGEDVADFGGHGMRTRAEAEIERRGHIREHRKEAKIAASGNQWDDDFATDDEVEL